MKTAPNRVRAIASKLLHLLGAAPIPEEVWAEASPLLLALVRAPTPAETTQEQWRAERADLLARCAELNRQCAELRAGDTDTAELARLREAIAHKDRVIETLREERRTLTLQVERARDVIPDRPIL